MLMAKGIPAPAEKFLRLLRGCRVNEPAHGGDAIGGKAYALGVF
jgi:hypothetical protein